VPGVARGNKKLIFLNFPLEKNIKIFSLCNFRVTHGFLSGAYGGALGARTPLRIPPPGRNA